MKPKGGTIGVLSSDLARYADFCTALMHVQTPPDTKLIWTKGADVVGNMNRIVDGFEGEWLWILGDDHVFAPGLLMGLLAREVHCVVPMCLKRTPPYDPVVYSEQNDRGEYVAATELPERGMVPVHAAGSAGMLVTRELLEAVGRPAFESHGGLNEDLTFCRKIRDAGFRIWCDTEAFLGHIGLVSIWPQFRDGEWQVQLDLGGGVMMPVNRIVKHDAAKELLRVANPYAEATA